MLVVKDTSALIHLAKISLLEKSCKYFVNVVMPPLVYEEAMEGIERGYADATLIAESVKRRIITIKKVKSGLVRKCNLFNIYKGEAEAVALYWQENADFLATDDDNVRKKGRIINVKTIGTLAIALKLLKEGVISKEKFEEAVSDLRKIGWFSEAVVDDMLVEGLKWRKQ